MRPAVGIEQSPDSPTSWVARWLWIAATAAAPVLVFAALTHAAIAFAEGPPGAHHSGYVGAAAVVLALLVFPGLERCQRRRIIAVLIIFAGLTVFALGTVVRFQSSGLPTYTVPIVFATTSFFGQLVAGASMAAYVGSLDQTSRVEWLLWRAFSSSFLANVVASSALAWGRWLDIAGWLSPLADCGLLGFSLVVAGLTAGATLPRSSTGDTASTVCRWSTPYAAALVELRALPGAWNCLITLALLRLPLAMGQVAKNPALQKLASDLAGVATMLQVAGTVALPVGFVAGWVLACRTPVQKLLWTTAPVILAMPLTWGLLAFGQPAPVSLLWLAVSTGELASGYVGCILLVFMFRVIGRSRHCLSLCALAVMLPHLVERAVLRFCDKAVLGGLPGLMPLVLSSFVAVAWALVAWRAALRSLGPH